MNARVIITAADGTAEEFPITQAPTFQPGSILDVWTAAHGQLAFEVEVSNAAIKPGVKSRPMQDGVRVQVVADDGFVLYEPVPRGWPTRFPTMRGTWRRYGIYRKGSLDRLAAQDAALGNLLQFPAAAFGPASLALPALTAEVSMQLEATNSMQLQTLMIALKTWTPYSGEDEAESLILFPGFGWRPLGVANPAEAGGPGIYFGTGWQQNKHYARRSILLAQCAHERQFLAYDKETGVPISADDYGAISPDYTRGGGDPINSLLPEFQGVASSDPLPLPNDCAHAIRDIEDAIAAAEMIGSPMCKRMIAVHAAQMRLVLSEKGTLPHDGYSPLNLLNMAASAQDGQGVYGYASGRFLGWPAWSMAEDVKINRKSAGSVSWCKAFVELVKAKSMPSGVLQRVVDAPGSVWYSAGHATAQSFEVAILCGGVVAAARQSAVRVPDTVLKCARSLLIDAQKEPYYNANVGPWHFLFVADAPGSPYTKLSAGMGNGEELGDATHMEFLAALAFDISSDQAWLSAAASVGVPTPTWMDKQASLESATNLDGTCFLLGAMQTIQ